MHGDPRHIAYSLLSCLQTEVSINLHVEIASMLLLIYLNVGSDCMRIKCIEICINSCIEIYIICIEIYYPQVIHKYLLCPKILSVEEKRFILSGPVLKLTGYLENSIEDWQMSRRGTGLVSTKQLYTVTIESSLTPDLL